MDTTVDRFTPLTEFVDLMALGKMEGAVFGEVRTEMSVKRRIQDLRKVLIKQPNFLEGNESLFLPQSDSVAVSVNSNNRIIRQMFDALVGHIERMERVITGVVNVDRDTSLAVRMRKIQETFDKVDRTGNPRLDQSLDDLNLG